MPPGEERDAEARVLMWAVRPWVCMHGVNVTQSGCADCELLLEATLAEGRRRYVRERMRHEARFGADHTLPWYRSLR